MKSAHPQHFRFRAVVDRRPDGRLVVILPATSVSRLETKGQVRVTGSINGVPLLTTAFPTGRGGHFIFVGRSVQMAAGLKRGDSVRVVLAVSGGRRLLRVPSDLRQVLRASPRARRHFESLTPAARTIATTWIDQAKGAATRRRRIADVLRRAERAYRGEGPFYPGAGERIPAAAPDGKMWPFGGMHAMRGGR